MNKKKTENKTKVIKTIKPSFHNNLFSEEQKNLIISTVIEYAKDHTKLVNETYYKDNKILDDKIKNNVLKSLDKAISLKNKRTTFPDELTSIYLETYYGHENKNRKLFIDAYANQKQVEMQIGNLLELYIQKECLAYGWCHTGTTIKDVDFIKKRGTNWESHQIKLSDNTENNAGSKVRHGTDIWIWQRRCSKQKDTYYWNDFKEVDLKEKLSEEKFRTFIKNYFNNITKTN